MIPVSGVRQSKLPKVTVSGDYPWEKPLTKPKPVPKPGSKKKDKLSKETE